MASKVQLTGGAFQDSEGNVLANGYLEMKLSQDSAVNTSQIASGIKITILLNSSGSVVASPAQSVWGNDQLVPANSFYTVTGYTAKGQPAWGPNNQQVIGDGGTFDVGTWVPNQVISWTPPLQTPLVEVNGVPLTSQQAVNFEDSATVTFSNPSAGVIQATAAPSTPPSTNVGQISFNGESTQFVLAGVPTGTQQTVSITSVAVPGNSKEPASITLVGSDNPIAQVDASFRTGVNTSFANNVLWSRGNVRRLAFRLRLNNSNARYWIGFYNTVQTLNGALFASDTPNVGYFGFRCKAGVISIAAGTDNTHQTITATAVTVDTANSQLFEIVPATDGLSVSFFIDGVSVGTISTNLVPTSDLLACFFTGDNLNTAFNAENFNFYWVRIETK